LADSSTVTQSESGATKSVFGAALSETDLDRGPRITAVPPSLTDYHTESGHQAA
jgi:hypothetical protein